MTKWEYRDCYHVGNDLDDFLRLLNTFGLEGWELVSIRDTDAHGDSMLAILKREFNWKGIDKMTEYEIGKPKVRTEIVREQIRLMEKDRKIDKGVADRLIKEMGLDDIDSRFQQSSNRKRFLDDFTELLERYGANINFGTPVSPSSFNFQISFPEGPGIWNDERYVCYSISPQLLQTLKRKLKE